MALTVLTNGSTDSRDGRQTTFIEADWDVSSAPTTPSPLAPEDMKVRAAAKVRGSGADDENNVLIQGYSELKDGKVSLWRYVFSEAPGGFACGMTIPDKFASGYRCKSVNQRSVGNLCTRGCLKSDWAPRLKAGSTLDWFIERQGNVLTIYPAIDNIPHKAHFTVEFGDQQAIMDHLCPLVVFGAGNYEAWCVEYSSVNIPTTAAYKSGSTQALGPVGSWIFRPSFDPEITCAWENCKLRVTDRDRTLSFKIANTINSHVKLQEGGSIVKGPGPTISTMMAPLPPMDRVEASVKNWVETLDGKTWSINTQDRTLTVADKIFDEAPGDNFRISLNDNVIIQ